LLFDQHQECLGKLDLCSIRGSAADDDFHGRLGAYAEGAPTSFHFQCATAHSELPGLVRGRQITVDLRSFVSATGAFGRSARIRGERSPDGVVLSTV